jgi:hypothetical protein
MASRIADILVRAKLIDELQLRSAHAHQQQWGGRLPHIVVEKRFSREEKVVDAIADAMHLPKVDLEQVEHDPAALAKLDAEFCQTNGVFPCALKDSGKTLWLSMSDPTDVPVVDQVSFKARVRIKIVVSSERQIQAAIKRFYLGETDAGPQQQAYGSIVASEELASGGSDEDGKIVDMSGHTLVKNIKDIRPPEKPAPPTAADSDVLDDPSGSAGSEPGWSAQDLARLRSIQDQQEKGARILKAVLDLCVQKGYFSLEEYRAKVRKAGG